MAPGIKKSRKRSIFLRRQLETASSSNANRRMSQNIQPVSSTLEKCMMDAMSIKGRFSWHTFSESYHVPYIVRIINGEHVKFVPVRMAETKFFKKKLENFTTYFFTCLSVKSHFITESEAALLNCINIELSNQFYGKKTFKADEDYIVSLEDLCEFITFIENIFFKLKSTLAVTNHDVFGFIKTDIGTVLTYYVKNNKKYFPVFYFRNIKQRHLNQSITLDNWSLAYIKCCCIGLGMRKEYLPGDSCIAINLDEKYCSETTTFEFTLPPARIIANFLSHSGLKIRHFSGAWIKKPYSVPKNVHVSQNAVLPMHFQTKKEPHRQQKL